MRAPREGDLIRACLQYLRLRKIPAWRTNTGAVAARSPSGRRRYVRFNAPGWSDLTGLIPPSGRFLAVEVKQPGNRPTIAQEAFIEGIRAAGGLAGVVHSVAELEALLAE